MHKLTVVAASLVLGASLLAACGDSGSAAPARTATVPHGKLAGLESCLPDDFALTYSILGKVKCLSKFAVPCDKAAALAATFLQTKAVPPGYTCTHAVRGTLNIDKCLDKYGRGFQAVWE